MVCVAVCRLELNAADWNLNCDLAVANCESAAELPIKPLSSSHSRFSFLSVGLFLSIIFLVCLRLFSSVSLFFIIIFKKVQISLLLSYLMFWTYFSVHKQHVFHFLFLFFSTKHGYSSLFSLLQFSRFRSRFGLSNWCCNSMLPFDFFSCFLNTFIILVFVFLFFSYELLALSLKQMIQK